MRDIFYLTSHRLKKHMNIEKKYQGGLEVVPQSLGQGGIRSTRFCV
ncbi:hypothetical protein CAEBREN_23075 [Caenorhabditis brenneri]|uniref:Uncharacterized protein n=1 Tax=Caenorhabditis brenneri TaxID=135651 RepID=G0MFN3_CAEBE|nr:hypothetical protein CAEBREN_23075 [Caenorhabditis brenneri]